MTENEKTIKIAAMGDVHIEKEPQEISFVEEFRKISEEADVLALCGDLTTLGQVDQVLYLIEQLKVCTIPVVAVLGNHEHEAGEEDEIVRVLKENKITVLDGDSHVIKGVGFAGTKGFGGGFRGHILAPFGEKRVKEFSREAEDEKIKLEKGLQALDTPKRVVILHYSPIRETVEGEPLEIYPFLGSSALEEAIDNYDVAAVFHGHAHYGSLEGKTRGNIPVFNVAVPLLRRNGMTYRVVEI